ncbi:polygalacturonase At1g48100-like [Chenopodium quinoa]|uniref:polygalacturonase At1g48100-like n=1 Tax=Chenopodium quinoa TaxID=63459 RepID=UPI000B78DB4A|nr:polygalacturonase At1g48100-like [Chenopodium quinoa]
MAYIIKVSMFLTMFSLCSIFSLIQGRILTSMPLNEPYKNSQISIPPSQAPNVNSPKPPSYIDASPAPSPSYVNRGSSSNSTIVQANVFDVRSYGAIGDGLTDDTLAFKSAWDGACQVDNAKVVAPRGFSFMLQPLVFTGPCKSAIVFQLEGTIMPPDGPESWPKNSSKRQWLIFYRIHGLTLQGGGLIDGRGDKWWNLPCKPHKGINGTTLPGPCDSPVAIRFFGSTNLTLRGLRIMNSPQFHIRVDSCQNVSVDSLVIKSPGNSPNTDGIHVENTNDVTIHNSVISNGDDCISIGANTHNLDIRNVTCGPSHGISIGSLGVHNSKACVSNITVSNCMIKHSDNGVRIKTWQGGFGSVTGVTFEAIHMDTVRNPIIIDQYYCLSSNCSNQTAAISISDISYSNIKGTYDPRTPPVHLACSDAVPCTNITVSGLELLPAATATTTMTNGHKRKMEPFCWNAYGSNVGDLTTPPIYCLLEGLPYLDVGSDVGQC